MKCPVCKTSGIPADTNKCPNCNADFEGLQLLAKVKKSSKSRLTVAIVSSVLFVIVLIAWIIGYSFVHIDNAGSDSGKVIDKEMTDAPELNSLKSENAKLTASNQQLEKQIKVLQKEQEKKETTYVVKEDETLFMIARIIYGNGFKYLDIAKDNQIEPPYLINVGQNLKIYY